jgi:hypothetical protein
MGNSIRMYEIQASSSSASEEGARILPGTTYINAHSPTTTRICPGKDIAFALLWTAIASILATFDLTPVKGELTPLPAFTSSLVRLVLNPRLMAMLKLLMTV